MATKGQNCDESMLNGALMLQAYRQGICDGFNAVCDCGRINKDVANVMVGYLSAAVVGLRIAGNEKWASKLEQCARRLNNDWTCYERAMRGLITEIDADESQSFANVIGRF